jgi:hypothetical protein
METGSPVETTAIDPLIEMLDESRTLLETASGSFQIFAKLVSGKTVTLNDITPKTTIAALHEQIKSKDGGIPVSEKYLVYGGKNLYDGTVGTYGIGREATVHVMMRLRGGYGERQAVKYTLDKGIQRGNNAQTVEDTGGKSRAHKDWGRHIASQDSVYQEIFRRLRKLPDVDLTQEWWEKNQIHVRSLIQEITGAGNCGDFAQIVHSQLVANTDDQHVYEVVMAGAWDHQLCLTYPSKVSSIAAMDKEIATIADGWDNYKVCTLQSFIDGNNAYGHKMTWANLKIVKKEACTGDGPPPKLKSAIVAIVGDDLDDYTESASFKKDKKTAMDKVDAGYNFGTRHAPIPDEVDDDRETEDIVRQLDQIGGEDWETFEAEALSLADHQLWNYFAVSEGARDNIFKQLPVRRRLYKLLLEDNDSDFLWAMSHLEDDQFVDFFSHDSGTGAARDRVLSLSRTRQRMFDIFSSAPDGILATQCAWIGPDNFVAYFTSSATARDKVLGSSALRESLYATADKQGKAGFQAIMAHMTDEQLQAFADSTPARMEKCRKIKAIAKRLA